MKKHLKDNEKWNDLTVICAMLFSQFTKKKKGSLTITENNSYTKNCIKKIAQKQPRERSAT